MAHLRGCITLVLGLTGLWACAWADDHSLVKTSGYGTVGGVYTDTTTADFVSNVLKANGAGATRRFSTNVDTNLAVQFDLLRGQWSAVLQLVSEQQPDGSYRPTVEWANLKWQATPDLALRAGRIALPLFLSADYRKIGFAYPWVRPPVEVYGAVPITSSDGVDLTYRMQHRDVLHTTQLSYGNNRQNLELDTDLVARGIAGLSHTVSYRYLTLRAAYLRAKVTVDLVPQLFDGLRQFGPTGQALADRYQLRGKSASVASVGLSYDPGGWFVMTEWGRMRSPSFLGDHAVFYASAGWRRGNLTPYLTWATARVNGSEPDGLPVALLPVQVQPVALGLNAGLDQLLRAIPGQTTSSAGLRWDVYDGVALKLQVDRTIPRGRSYGTFKNVQPGFIHGGTHWIYSATVSFVF